MALNLIGRIKRDPSLLAIPAYFLAMAAERSWYRRRPERAAMAGAYERRDTIASLSMGTLSVVAPLVIPPLLRPLTPGRGRAGRALVGVALGAGAAAFVADRVVARAGATGDDDEATRTLVAMRVQRIAGPVAVITGGVAAATLLSSRTEAAAMFRRRVVPDLGEGVLGWMVAMVGWDFLYYWSHRVQHEVRSLWAIHVVHHSSERYNLSTALRQPVAESFGTMMPYGVLGLLGVRPSMILRARGLNLVWQFWIHTEAVRTLGAGEAVLSTPSAHRVHHGSNRRYLDRNHGGILIIWDRLFGTFEREDETVVYGLTENIDSFSSWTIATHEYRRMFIDVAGATSWGERAGHVLRPPGWRPELAAASN